MMKRISTKFVLVAAATFMAGTAMAQTDTAKAPAPDTTQAPAPTDTTSAPKDESLSKINLNNETALTLNQYAQATSFYATDKILINTKEYDLKTEEETEA